MTLVTTPMATTSLRVLWGGDPNEPVCTPSRLYVHTNACGSHWPSRSATPIIAPPSLATASFHCYLVPPMSYQFPPLSPLIASQDDEDTVVRKKGVPKGIMAPAEPRGRPLDYPTPNPSSSLFRSLSPVRDAPLSPVATHDDIEPQTVAINSDFNILNPDLEVLRVPLLSSKHNLVVGRLLKMCDFYFGLHDKLVLRTHLLITYNHHHIVMRCLGVNGLMVRIPRACLIYKTPTPNSFVILENKSGQIPQLAKKLKRAHKLIRLDDNHTEFALARHETITLPRFANILCEVNKHVLLLNPDDVEEDLTEDEEEMETDVVEPARPNPAEQYRTTLKPAPYAIPKHKQPVVEPPATPTTTTYKEVTQPTTPQAQVVLPALQPAAEIPEAREERRQSIVAKAVSEPPRDTSPDPITTTYARSEFSTPEPSQQLEKEEAVSAQEAVPTQEAAPAQETSVPPPVEQAPVEKKNIEETVEETNDVEDKENVGVLPSNKPSKQTLTAPTANETTEGVEVQTQATAEPTVTKRPAEELPQRKKQKTEQTELSLDLPVESAVSDGKSLKEIKNILVNHLAFLRLSLTPALVLNTVLALTQTLSLSQIRVVLHNTDCIGVIYREGKDAAGKPLEEEYYYVPEKDDDEERKQLVATIKGHGGLRACRRKHKQYYWKKPAPIKK